MTFLQNIWEHSAFMPIYLITVIISIYRYPRYYDSILKYFPIILTLTFLVELLGYLIGYYESFQIIFLDDYENANYFIYNLYDLVYFIYFYYIFWKKLKDPQSKQIVKVGAAIYILAAMTNPFFENFLIFPQVLGSVVGAIVLVIIILLYFKERNKNDNILFLWMGIGLVIFNLLFPFVLLIGRLEYSIYEKLNLRLFHHFLILAMYTCFIIGFLKMRRMTSIEKENQQSLL